MIKLENLHKNFGRTKAVDGVTLDIAKGNIVGLLGENGSGKSTLLKLMAGLQFPTRGHASIAGTPVGRQTKAWTSYAPESNAFYKWMSVRDILQYQRLFFADFAQDRCDELVSFMQLPMEARVGTLSKGMQARLRLTAALSREAKVQLLDEPFSGIDPLSRKKILDALIDQFRFQEQTMIISTHEVAAAERLFDEILFMAGGRVLLQGSADQLRAEHNCSIEDLFGKVGY